MSGIQFDGADIRISANEHIVRGARKGVPFVTFSSRSRQPISPIFGGDFFARRGIPALHVQSKWNHWWHTPEMAELAEVIARLRLGPSVLYGSSMGGYGALMFGRRLEAAAIVALSPQAYILAPLGTFDTRWDEYRPFFSAQFDEEIALREQAGLPAWIFVDRQHALDRPHLEILDRVRGQVGANAWHLIDVPYGYHPVSPALQKAGILGTLLDDLYAARLPDTDALVRRSQLAYRKDPKSLFNYLRGVGEDALEHHRAMAHASFESGPADDHEFLFMSAEVFLKLGEPELAMTISERSVAAAEAPAWLATKHAGIVASVRGADVALRFLRGLPHLNGHPDVLRVMERLERRGASRPLLNAVGAGP
ncbi:alpha/beta hydrolase family protein [Pseudoroseomonas sp. WGS1072]|uniref:hypothetical protein n=1 Tax=Roseomonas sp. WGS1072 TaxID=3366816 RepID=UPI003BF39FCB